MQTDFAFSSYEDELEKMKDQARQIADPCARYRRLLDLSAYEAGRYQERIRNLKRGWRGMPRG